MPNVMEEFLVLVGYKVDEESRKKMLESIERTSGNIANSSKHAVSAITLVVEAVAKVGEQYEALHYQSLRTGTSVAGLKAVGFAAQSVGISTESAVSSLAALNMQLLNPGKRAYADVLLQMSTRGMETARVSGLLVDHWKELAKLGDAGIQQAFSEAANFGQSPEDVLRRMQLREREIKFEEIYNEKLRRSGVDTKKLAHESEALGDSQRKLGASVGLMIDQAALKIMPLMTTANEAIDRIAMFAVSAGNATGGVTSAAGMLAAASGTTSIAAVLLKRFGFKSAAGLLGTSAGLLGAIAGPIGLAALWWSLVEETSKTKQGKDFKSTGDISKDLPSMIRAMRPAFQKLLGYDPADLELQEAGSKGKGGAKSSSVMDYFVARGWSREAAAGIAANLSAESKFDPRAMGDGGAAYGVAQWHPDRQAEFKRWSGKDIRQSSLDEQLAFVHYELTEGSDAGARRAGNQLRGVSSAGAAGAIVSQQYERPFNAQGEALSRARLAQDMFRATLTPPSSDHSISMNQTNNINVTGAADPHGTAEAVGREVKSSTADLVRNAGTGVR